MPWFKIDDEWHNHPKIAAAGNAAAGLWARCGSYSSGYLTEGFIPDAIANTYGTKAQIARLCDVELWVKVPGGYRIPDFLDYNPTAEAVKDQRAKAAERQRRARERADASRGESRRDSRGESRDSHTPPDPDPPVIHTQETDDREHSAPGSSSSIDIAFRVAARAQYLKAPGKCREGNPDGYIAGIERIMRDERRLDAQRLARTVTDPIELAGALVNSDETAKRAAHELGLLPDWQPTASTPRGTPGPIHPGCLLCEETGYVEVGPRTSAPCPEMKASTA